MSISTMHTAEYPWIVHRTAMRDHAGAGGLKYAGFWKGNLAIQQRAVWRVLVIECDLCTVYTFCVNFVAFELKSCDKEMKNCYRLQAGLAL
ncbi:hypothetical protein PY730_27840 (plasmid) [Klebsiella pneumoniae]|nr:hypothetical protein PY730_27840 [Klebsiella pneumoniae]